VVKVEHLKGTKKRVVAIILAGGKSSRFGKDKAKLKIGSYSLTYYQYKKLKKIFKKVYISTKKDKFCFKTTLIYDKQKQFLPILSLINLLQKFHKIFVIPVDVPLLKVTSIYKLIKLETITSNSPFIGVYNYRDIKKLKENIKKGNFSPRIGKKGLEFEEKELLNLNYKNDFKKWKFQIKKELLN